MNFDFIKDLADDENTRSSDIVTGWENVVFELEDEPVEILECGGHAAALRRT